MTTLNKNRFDVPKEIFAKRDDIVKAVAAFKEEAEQHSDLRPYVVLAALKLDGKLVKVNPLKASSIEIVKFKITNGHCKPNTFINMRRMGKLIVGFYLPDFKTYADAVRSQASNMQMNTTGAAGLNATVILAEKAGDDPFALLRSYLTEQVSMVMGNWNTQKQITGLESKVDKLEKIIAKGGSDELKKAMAALKDQTDL